MPDPKILSGFTSGVPKSSRLGFFFGLGSPAKTIYLSSLGAPPFDSNEYIAVAMRRGLLMPVNVALAYRLVGLKGSAESAGLTSAALFIGLGLMGAINLVVFPAPASGLLVMYCFGIVLGSLNVYRVREILKAKRLLADWSPTPPP